MQSHNTYEIMLAKIRAFRATRETIAVSLEPADVTIMQWLLLGSIKKNGGTTTPGVAADELQISRSLITQLSKSLAGKKLISINSLENDKRGRELVISSEGIDMLAKTDPMIRQSLKEWLAPIDREHVDIYMQVLLQVAYKL